MNALLKTIINAAVASDEGSGKFSAPYWDSALIAMMNKRLRAAGKQQVTQRAPNPAAKENNSVVLFSGGIFSYLVLYRELLAGRHVVAVHVGNTPATDLAWHLDYAWAQGLNERTPDGPIAADFAKIVDTPTGKKADLEVRVMDHEVANGPLADLFLLANGATTAADLGIQRVVTGHNSVSADVALLRSMNTVFANAGMRVKLTAPIQHLAPTVAVAQHQDAGFSKETLLLETYSCEDPGRNTLIPMCGECWGCYRRWQVFKTFSWVEQHFQVLPWNGRNYVAYNARWAQLAR